MPRARLSFRRSLARLAGVLVGVGLVAASCSSAVDELSEDSSGWVAYDLLGWVPDSSVALRYVEFTDYDRALELVGATRPAGVSEDEVRDFLYAISDSPRDARPPSAFALPVGFQNGVAFEAEAWRDEFGFSIVSTRAAVVAGRPPDDITVYDVGDDADQIDDAVRSDPVWSDLLDDREYEGVGYYFWSDGEIDFERVTPARRLARGGVLAVDGSLAVRATTVQPLEDAIDARDGDDGLDDNGTVRAVLRELDTAGVYSFFLSDEVPEPFRDLDELDQPLTDVDGLAPYELLAGGITLDDDMHLNVLVFAHASAETAAENVNRLTDILEEGSSAASVRPWAEFFVIRSIEAVGSLTVAVLEIDDASPLAVFDAFFRSDSLYWVG